MNRMTLTHLLICAFNLVMVLKIDELFAAGPWMMAFVFGFLAILSFQHEEDR